MGLFDVFKKKEKPVPEQEPDFIAPKKYVHEFTFRDVPKFNDGIRLAYGYQTVESKLVDLTVYEQLLKTSDYCLDVTFEGEVAKLYWNNLYYGEIHAQKYVRMVRDFAKRNECVKAFALSDKMVYLAFYKDKKKGLEKRESTVFELTSYKGRAKQEEIMLLDDWEELSIDENSGDIETENLNQIGKVPAPIIKKIKNEGYKACFFDHYDLEENDDGDEVYIPYAKIYW